MKTTRWVPSEKGVFDPKDLEARLKNARYEVTTLKLASGAYHSDHSHPDRRAEAVLSGQLRISSADREFVLEPGDFVELRRGEVHRSQVLGKDEAVIMEGCLPNETPESHLIPRLVALAVLLVVLNFWVTRHLSFGLRDVLVVNAVVIFLPQILRWLDPREQLTVERFFRRGLWYLAKPPVLLVLLFALVVAVLTWSSIEILPNSSSDPTEIWIAPDPESAPPFPPSQRRRTIAGRQESFLLGISPSGTTYNLRAEGYFNRPLVLFPWKQEVVPLGTLDPLPSILVRLPQSRLGEGGWLDITPNGQEELKSIPIAPWQGSVTLGASIHAALLDTWATQWLLDLAESESVSEPALQKRYIEIWSRTVTLNRQALSAIEAPDLWDELLKQSSRFRIVFRSQRNPNLPSTRPLDIVVPDQGEKQQFILEADD